MTKHSLCILFGILMASKMATLFLAQRILGRMSWLLYDSEFLVIASLKPQNL